MLDSFKWWIGLFFVGFIIPAINIFVLEEQKIEINVLYRYMLNTAVYFIYSILVERGRPKFVQKFVQNACDLISDLSQQALALIYLLVSFAFPVLGIIGFFYWLWMSINIGSFWMFIVGITPFVIITVPVGAWSLFFGIPDWVVNIFG